MAENYLTCPNCGGKYHIKAGSCPRCKGKGETQPRKSSAKGVFSLLALVLVGVFLLFALAERTPRKAESKQVHKQVTTNDNSTIGQKNALRKAKAYLYSMPFSKDGLVKQLEYEGFSTSDAIYGAENSNANWNEQAAKKAKAYLDTMSFSRSGLIDQLKYDGFSLAESEYGVKAVGY